LGLLPKFWRTIRAKPLWGYKSLVFSVLVIGFLSFIVWAHHMWMTGMGSAVSAFFQTTTLLIINPVGDHLKRVFHFAVGRLHSLQRADALHHGVSSADVRDRRAYRDPAGV